MLRRFGTLSRKKRISAKSLPYVIITLLLIGIVLSSIVLMVSYFYKITSEFENQNSLIDKAKSIRNFCNSKLGSEGHIQNSFNDIDAIENVAISKGNWGVLDRVQFKTWSKNDTIKETLFLGENRDRKISLYIPNIKKQLKLGGKTIIEGDVCFPMNTYGELYIPQKSNDIKIKGRVYSSLDRLPTVRDFLIEKNVEPIDLGSFNKVYSNSFFSSTKKIIVENGVLEDLKINGNVIIESRQKLIIKKNVELRDVIVLAPEVVIENGFVGNIQVLATKKIKLEENAKLNFPSVLYLKSEKEGEIIVEDESYVLGAIIGVSEENKTNITINKNVKIVGDLFCTGRLSFKGEMFGEVRVNQLYYRTNESEYGNAAFDLKIFNLPSFTSQLRLFEEKRNTYRILKCIK
ncbi:hypothetical protein SAMN04489761_3337 [Tenacibaculum sp. MAR_2009_124]|uniref:hypothetical protein n=1 Tax=Tenacibaculum sp. MAR_2009_124 TaxID=1250059 RepID=UPI0008978615|nr:hypothetical protein [Tenacibaculum sp. MAR_2009_124]SEC56394.1 hypothetical protein SAMN04489761_3337 [Tenacibaculum sp. MAR_2009_124]